MDKVFTDENKTCQFDFSRAIWATDKLNEIYHKAKIFLSDVDFIVESEDYLLLVEYKNAKFAGAQNPDAFNPAKDKYIDKVVRKYYDSIIYIQAKRYKKRCIYVYVLEYPCDDRVSREYIRNRIRDKLPFLLQEQENFAQPLIDDVLVMSIDEWNKRFTDYQATLLI